MIPFATRYVNIIPNINPVRNPFVRSAKLVINPFLFIFYSHSSITVSSTSFTLVTNMAAIKKETPLTTRAKIGWPP